MVQRQETTVTVKEARERAFREAIKVCSTPEAAAVRLGVSVSTVMRFKRREKAKRK